MKANNKVIVVTGGGNGVGRELVLQLLAKGASVAAVDINKQALDETLRIAGCPQKLSLHVADITNYEAILKLVDEVVAKHGKVDGIINNAGIIQPFINLRELKMDQIDRVMNVNYFGTLNMIKAFLPLLQKRPEAHIVNISSMGGFLPVPGQSIYGASKAAVRMLSEALYSELLNTNVHVTVVIPGGIATDIKKNSYGSSKSAPEEQKNSNMLLSPAKAASLILKGMETDKYKMIIGKDANLMNLLYSFSPKAAISLMNKVMAANSH
ncbi:Short-chain dehydrogenase [Anaerovirgula multivorans]|uniref:Short-chain dehydrogenase n=1 Tax=Anaerovirgula multivorans TaxID=312168 RepID=A0A239GIG9_9FIRM|nr:SDR family oxidoreductase [Anaerovirgula multivorans]SNS68811.1 Short-chain dehydrogenase [Anaerovirgula multivorans]